ncbi:ankyrin repeat domain-containing protein SOWAHC-like isoform X2 [Betta splendens]|uniref:Ankyrin repeat domain-containing protein SOWAHC-like isoform X2 n=1 Tax=Betta splendens TaxID=158456 RepID=A0A9W2XMH1_BETSP|nr:ankyrin repeat domain-containing protein SOWAHC-like isoform X2 [Betta splendens]
MATECSEEAVLRFIRERGGKVTNTELIQHFNAVFPEDPEQRAAARYRFKQCVDGIAVVKAESGVKYVCLRKKFRGSVKALSGSHSGQVSDAQVGVAPPPAGAALQGPSAADVSLTKDRCRAQGHGSVSVVEQVERSSAHMGNAAQRETRGSRKEPAGPDIPQISVTVASPLPVQGPVFNLPEPAQTGSTGPSDADSLSDSEGTSSPRSGRRPFIQVKGNPSPRLRRSSVLRPSGSRPSSEADSASPVPSLDEDRPAVTLEPLEHEWMMCSSDGRWASLSPLLTEDPGLILRKDFVSGFTCLHWAAKHGKPELIALIMNFAKRHNVPISVDVRSSTGYTPLHVAAMHNHMEVVKLLVGAYSADVEIRDYGGRKACQYLTDSVSVDIRDIIGAYEESDSDRTDQGKGGRWRFSKVLQANLKPLRLRSFRDSDSVDSGDGPREKPLRRKSSLSRMKPKLQKLRERTSQIVQSTSFHETEELSMTESFKARPKTHFW